MARKPRVDVAGATHHVAGLAMENDVAFREAADRIEFLARLERVVECYQWNCRAYCLMGTHFHLIVHTPAPNLSRGLQNLCGPYALWFNWKYSRRGHLFARRFVSAHIETDSHLLEAHRYVALNPVRAGLCEAPGSWPWGSYRAIAGLEPAPGFLDVDGVLELFDARPDVARETFRAFVGAANAGTELH
jgi:REP element-mobilizing transposase RayT